MRTQSPDTSVEAERVLIELIRGASMAKRFRPVQAMAQRTFWANMHAWQEKHPEASEKETAVHFVALMYGKRLAARVKASLGMDGGWQRQPVDIARLLNDLEKILNKANIPWYLGGSLASSLHGMPQVAQDIDIVVHCHPHLLASLSALFAHSFLVDEKATQRTAIKLISLPLIHRDSLIKVDLIHSDLLLFRETFCPGPTSYVLDERYQAVRIASASEMIIFKLQRYQQGLLLRTNGMQDDAEWNDILGMLKVQAPVLDLAFLQQWSQKLQMIETWHRAVEDAGLHKVK